MAYHASIEGHFPNLNPNFSSPRFLSHKIFEEEVGKFDCPRQEKTSESESEGTESYKDI